MAILKLTIYKLGDQESDIALDTSKLTAKYKFKDENSNYNDYKLSLVGLDVTMQMYRPTEILADISIAMYNGNTWQAISRKCFEIFKDKKVSLHSDSHQVGTDFYVHEVIPERYAKSMHLKLKIYSPDKLLTLKNTSRTFVGKRLSEILTSELRKYSHPADKDTGLQFNTDHLQVLNFDRTVNGKAVTNEHIFPFLVQYNESLYDLLARTANRWGEFMYYRDGKLHFGYNAKQEIKDLKTQDGTDKYYKITYPSYNTDAQLIGGDASGAYHMQAVYDATVSETPVEESPYLVKGELGKFNGAEDKYAMRKVASFLGNDKDMTTWLTNNLVDDLVSLGQSTSYKKLLNDKINKDYFTDMNATNPHYGEHEFTLYDDETETKNAFNQFTELHSEYNGSKYQEILEGERTAGENLVQIDFDTTSPDLNLGDLITVDSELFFVVGVNSGTTVTRTIKDGKEETITQQNFKVTVVGRKDNKSILDDKNIFYPTMLPSGHVRYSGPQKAVIFDENDPTLKHRVRVLFDWQYIEKVEKNEDTGKEKKEKKKIDDAEASPWLMFAGKGDGNPSTGRHVEGTEVLLGFVGDNIERPYVIGAIQNKAGYDSTIDVDLDTDKGHFLRLTDGSREGGLSSFLFGALSPAASTLANFIPNFAFNGGKSDRLEGGFSLGDFFGIYKISGSSDQRNITISSPWGDVKLNAFTGITISAPNGDVKISGKNVTIEAGNNLKLVSGTNAGYKIFRDKKYKSAGAGIAMTAAAAAANKLASKLKLIDLTFVRSVVEVVMRPVEGALTVKSNRYLKLEAGKNACEYPASAFNSEKRQKIIDKAAAKQFNGNSPLSDGFCTLFRAVGSIVGGLDKYNTRYNACVEMKKAFDGAIKDLKDWSNDPSQEPCQSYAQLKEKFWKAGGKITKGDLQFKDNLVGDKDYSGLAKRKNPNGDLNLNMKAWRDMCLDDVMEKATSLKNAIDKLLNLDVTSQTISNFLGQYRATIPKDGADKLCKAVNKANNKDLFIYKVADSMKDLTVKRPDKFSPEEQLFLERVFWLNLLDGYGIISSRKPVAGASLPAKPTVTTYEAGDAGNIMNNETWNAFIDSIDGVLKPEYEIVKTDGEKFKDALSGAAMSLIDLPNIRGMINERQAYADGGDGCILFGANDQTYLVGQGETAQLSKIKKLTPRVSEEGAKEFVASLKRILKGQNG